MTDSHSTTREIQVYELRCPECTADLDGISSDRMFVCPQCDIVFSALNGRLQKEPLYIADPLQPVGDNLLYLPFWRFDVATRVQDAQRRDITEATIAREIRFVWVPAFYEVRPNVFGNPGFTLSMARLDVTPTLWPADKKLKLAGAVRRSEEAAVYVHPYVCGMLDRSKDISGYHIEVTHQPAEYWAVPFSLSQREMLLRDLLCGAVYPTTMVERFEEIIMF